MTWLYQGREYTGEDAADFMGFIYLIVNKLDGRRYIGKKLFWFSKPRPKKVPGRGKRMKVESDWKDYYSSSKELQEDVEKLGKENFSREILYFCKTKGMMSYLEAREQFDNRVLENSDVWYNGQIQCRIHHTHVKV